VCRQARAHGALLRPLGDVIVILPPLAIPLSLLDRLGAIVYNSIEEVLRSETAEQS
jgi:adenosylmethionine-8-amino-7-oxononanoate aminotransferase